MRESQKFGQEVRLWAEYQQDINAGIDRMLSGVMQAFRVLNRIEWAAPWQKDRG